MKRTVVSGVLLILAFTFGFLVGERRQQKERLINARQREYSSIANERQSQIAREELERKIQRLIRRLDYEKR